jgi:hypothetical protein
MLDIVVTLLVSQLDKSPTLQLLALDPEDSNILDILVTALVFQLDKSKLKVVALYPAR